MVDQCSTTWNFVCLIERAISDVDSSTTLWLHRSPKSNHSDVASYGFTYSMVFPNHAAISCLLCNFTTFFDTTFTDICCCRVPALYHFITGRRALLPSNQKTTVNIQQHSNIGTQVYLS
jgi:hypothetical protein